MNLNATLVEAAQRDIRRGNSLAAVRALVPHVQVNPRDIEALNCLGHAFYEVKDLIQAEATYRQMWSLTPTDYRALYGLGVTLGALGRRDEARSWLTATLAVNPGFERAVTRLARLEASTSQRSTQAGPGSRQATGGPRPLTTLVMPEDEVELEQYRRASRKRARIDTMNEHWYGIPWPLRVIQVAFLVFILMAFLGTISNR